MTGRRQGEQPAPFDLVPVQGHALQNSINGGGNTNSGGLIRR
jgi:hypothetical protein